MSWHLDEEEFEAVQLMGAEERYRYFIEQLVESQEAWGLWSNEGGWWHTRDGEGNAALALWPHSRYADAFAKSMETDPTPKLIPLATLLDTFVPRLAKDGMTLAVFPVADGEGHAITPEEFREQLQSQLVDDGDEFEYDDY
ncbi:MAG: DUF2750 domain-containing protein [Gammaproteobacteria bacterium]|nr:DUF2750 domain-containing protein [Gammaproteobacteria bacterium]